MGWLKRVLPERIPALAAVFYALGPARIFEPHYTMIAEDVHLADGAVLVDLGTGPGILPVKIARRFPRARIVGIDLSEKMIEIAKGKGQGVENAEFIVMDAAKLRFDDNSLDMVLSTGAMHHWREPVKIFDEIYRCLKPGAEAWIYDGYAEASREAIKKGIRPLFLGLPSVGLARRILGIHGFSQAEYDTTIKAAVAKSRFKTAQFDPRGIMMRVLLKK